MSGIDLGDESRRLYEQIGTLYYALSEADSFNIGGGGSVESFADLLATVLKVAEVGRNIDRTDRSLALHVAIRRYEAERTGGRPSAA